MKILALMIWLLSPVAVILGCSPATSEFSAIPDLPSGWEKAGSASLVVLVVLLFLIYLAAQGRHQAILDAKRDERDAKLHQEHADRVGGIARELSDRFCESIDSQQENCKRELTQLADTHREAMEYIKTQHSTMLQRVLTLAGRATPQDVENTEGLGS